MSHELTRQELYGFVWAEPVSRLSRKFGVSDVAIAKACRRANIPVPGRGYWAKLQHGKAPARVPLPSPKPGISEMVRFTPPPVNSRTVHFSADVQAQVRKEVSPERKIVVAPTLANVHPIIRGWLKGSQGRPSEIERRRLRILSTIFKELEARGHAVVIDSRPVRTMSVGIGHERVEFSLRERQRQLRIPLTPEEKQEGLNRLLGRESRTQLKGIGELFFRIEQWIDGGIRKQWKDTSRKRLEEQLNDIIAGLNLAGASLRRWRLEREEAERQRIAAEQRRRELEEARRKREQEIQGLLRQVEAWQRAVEIRRYVQAMRNVAKSKKCATNPTEIERWAAWAIAVADEINPLHGKLAEVHCPPIESQSITGDQGCH